LRLFFDRLGGGFVFRKRRKKINGKFVGRKGKDRKEAKPSIFWGGKTGVFLICFIMSMSSWSILPD